MASTNKTTNYDLSQFLGTDKPTWLTDYNGDMSKIDAGMAANKTAADSNQSKIDAIEADIDTVQEDIVNLKAADTQTAQVINTLQSNQQNLQTRMGKAESDIAEIKGEIRKEEEIWIIVDNQNGIGIKDGTYQTGWAGYAMSYLGLTSQQVIVRCANGAGVINAGTGGATYKSLIEQAGATISVKTRVSRIIIGSLLNDAGNTVTTEIAALLALRQWCNLQFPVARVDWVEYYYPWSDLENKIPHYWWRNEVAQQIGSTGIRFCADFNMPTVNKTWFQEDGVNYNDEGQHQLGMRLANYLLTDTFDCSQPEHQLNGTALSNVATSSNFRVIPTTSGQYPLTSFWHEKLDRDGLHIHAFIMSNALSEIMFDINTTALYIKNPSIYWNPGFHDKGISSRPTPTEEYYSYGSAEGDMNCGDTNNGSLTNIIARCYLYPYAGNINGIAINGYKSFQGLSTTRRVNLPAASIESQVDQYNTIFGDFGPGQY